MERWSTGRYSKLRCVAFDGGVIVVVDFVLGRCFWWTGFQAEMQHFGIVCKKVKMCCETDQSQTSVYVQKPRGSSNKRMAKGVL